MSVKEKRFRRDLGKNWTKFSFVTDDDTAKYIRAQAKKFGSITNAIEQLIRTAKLKNSLQEDNKVSE